MKKHSKLISTFLVSALFINSTLIFAQGGGLSSTGEKSKYYELNTITTAVPFLIIAPDSRAGGMGDAGVSTSSDANAIHWNPAKLGFADKEMGFAVSYIPWLRKLVPDINLSYLSFYKKIDKIQTFGASLLYFSLGDITFTDINGATIGDFNPNEFSLDVAYSRLLSERVSGGIALRYIYSNLTGGINVLGADSKAGQAIAADISIYYQNDEVNIFNRDALFAFGANISNIGNKISYTTTSSTDFIPINLRFGPSVTFQLDEYNTITFTTDINKLLVPTPPIYGADTNNKGDIIAGKDPNRAVASGIFGSFSDAPGSPLLDSKGGYIYNPDGTIQVDKGSVFKEELKEFTFSFGTEYWYADQFAIRAGYFSENVSKGNRKFFTIGAGLKYNVFGLDFAYLIPVYFNSDNTQNSPLENTLRFTLKFDFDAFNAQEEKAE